MEDFTHNQSRDNMLPYQSHNGDTSFNNISSDHIPLNQIKEMLNQSSNNNGNMKSGLYFVRQSLEPLNLVPVEVIEIAKEENKEEPEENNLKDIIIQKVKRSNEELVRLYEENFTNDVISSIDTEATTKDLNAAQMQILGEYHRDYIAKHISKLSTYKKKVRVDRLKSRKSLIVSDNFLFGGISLEKESKFTILKRKMSNYFMKLGVSIVGPYVPDKKIKTIWDFIILVLSYYQLVMIPIQICFDYFPSTSAQAIDILTTIIFILDMAISFNTGIFVRGLLIRNRKSIAIHYFKFWFWADLVASFPYEAVFPKESSQSYIDLIYNNAPYSTFLQYFRFFQVVRLIRIFKLKKLFSHLENYLDLSNTMTNVFAFIKLSLYVFLVAHWIACYFHFEGLSERNESKNWIENYNIQNNPWPDRYLAAFYFGIATMQTVGFGDIVPVTTKERIITIIAMLIACGMFGYTMNKINLIVAGLENTTDLYKRSMVSISNYMRQKGVRKDLQMKIKKFLEYSLNEESAVYIGNNTIYNLLSDTLRFELLLQIQGRIVKKNKIFELLFSGAFLHKILDIVQEKIYAPDDIICIEESQDLGIYLISQGKVNVYHHYSGALMKQIGKGAVYGELSFFSGQPKTASAKSSDFTSLYYIDRDVFISRLSGFPYDHEKFYMVKDKVNLYKDYTELYIECFHCKKHGHISKNCQYVNSRFDRDKFLQEILEAQKNFVVEFTRKDRIKVVPYNKYDRMADASYYIQGIIHDAVSRSEKTKVQRKIVMKAFQHRKKELARQAASATDLDLGVSNISNDISDLDISANNTTQANGTTIITQTNGIIVEQHEPEEEVFRYYDFTKHTREDELNSPQLANKKGKKKADPYSLKNLGKSTKVFEDFDKVAIYKYYFTHNNLTELTKNM